MRQTRKSWQNVGATGVCIFFGLAVLSGCGGGGGGGSQSPSSRTLTTISIQGNLDPATGRFTQTGGTFDRFTGVLPPSPTPTPPPAPAGAAGAGGSLYTGTYTLDSRESGEFNFVVLPDNSAEGLAVPAEFFRYQTDPTVVGSGTATVSLQVSGATGTGTIQLSNGTKGTIRITGMTHGATPFRALKRRLPGS